MSDEVKFEIFNLGQRQQRIFRRFWFSDRGQMVCEFPPAISAVARLSAQIRILESACLAVAA